MAVHVHGVKLLLHILLLGLVLHDLQHLISDVLGEDRQQELLLSGDTVVERGFLLRSVATWQLCVCACVRVISCSGCLVLAVLSSPSSREMAFWELNVILIFFFLQFLSTNLGHLQPKRTSRWMCYFIFTLSVAVFFNVLLISFLCKLLDVNLFIQHHSAI